MAKKKNNFCTDFEEMLMWTSYRYCIGRHTYVVDMAYEIAEHYYGRLNPERQQFTAEDIRGEIASSLKFGPFSIRVHRVYNEDSADALTPLLKFIQKENIQSIEEMSTYDRIEFNAHTGEYEFKRVAPTPNRWSSTMDIEDLIPWLELANCFDVKGHKMITLADGTQVEAFRGWKREVVPIEDQPGYYRAKDFGWEEIWISVDDYVKGNKYRYIPDESVKEINDIKAE